MPAKNANYFAAPFFETVVCVGKLLEINNFAGILFEGFSYCLLNELNYFQ